MGPQPTTLMGVLIYIYGRQSEIIQTENGYFGITLCTTSSGEEKTPRRNWMFSIKNLCAKHLEAFPLPAEDVEYCKYVVQGKGEERMLRGYLQLKKATSEWRVKSMLNPDPYSCCYAKLWKQIHLANACAI